MFPVVQRSSRICEGGGVRSASSVENPWNLRRARPMSTDRPFTRSAIQADRKENHEGAKLRETSLTLLRRRPSGVHEPKTLDADSTARCAGQNCQPRPQQA